MDPEKFGSFIQQRRKELGLKQSDLALILNVTDKAVSRWERGIGFPDIKLLEPLAQALELSLTELIQSRKIEQNLLKEEADALLAETVELMEVQKKLSWQRKVILIVGHAAIIVAAFILFRATRSVTWEPEWLGKVVYLIGFAGAFFGSRALRYIVCQMYLKKHPWGIWHSHHTWVWTGLALLGGRILADSWLRGSIAGYVLSLLGGSVLLIAALVYYAYHEEEINE